MQPSVYAYLRDFNPRSHEGSDKIFFANAKFFMHFNPRSHEGSDMSEDFVPPRPPLFQPALPRGERLFVIVGGFHLRNFNPRSHEGSDDGSTWHKLLPYIISTRAPTRGATERCNSPFASL